MKITKWIENYSPYISKFGLSKGPKIAKSLFPKRHNNEVISVKIPQVDTSIYIRLGTSDVSNFHENFMSLEFPLPDYLSPQLIIDAGANAGYATLFLMNKFKQAKIISIEPDESNFEMLTMNCKSYSNFEGIKSAIWINDSFVKITNPESGHTGFRVEETTEKDKNSFPSITIQSILTNSGFDRIGILKLDIEGTEKELFEDNYKKWIDKVDVLIIELHDRFKPGCGLAFYSAIDSCDFIQYSQGENLVYIRKEILKANGLSNQIDDLSVSNP